MDARVKQIMSEYVKHDTSFTQPPAGLELIFGQKKYTQQEVRRIWIDGIEWGVEIGLDKASLEGQKLELTRNTKNSKHNEFIEKFYKLADEYGCAIQYHPIYGMVIIDKEKNTK